MLLQLCWVLFILSTTLCWPCSSDLCFPFSSSWASVPWACSCRVLFSGSVGVPLPARWLLVSSFWGFSSFRLWTFCRYAASSCVACSCHLLAAPLVCTFSQFAVYAVVRFLSAALPFSSLWSAGLCGCGLRLLWPSHIPWSPALSLVFSSPSHRRCWASASPLALLWGSGLAPAPSSAMEPSCGGFHVGGLFTPCVCCPCVLLGVHGFQTRRGFATCLLLTGAPGFRSFRSPPPLSLSALP